MMRDPMKGAFLSIVLTIAGAWTVMAPQAHAADQASVQAVLQKLNASPTVTGRDAVKSYTVLFDAYLKMSDPPMQVGAAFNLTTIHPDMSGWERVSAWAESNPDMAKAILEARSRRIVGLPYGRDGVPATYQASGLVADVAAGGDLRRNDFPYLDALETISAYAWAEVYRLMEHGQIQEGLDLATAHLAVTRQFCDREFLVEKRASILLLIDALSNMRDVFYKYIDQISSDQFRTVAISEIPFLRPDRNALFMPEGDRVVSEALITEVFDSRGLADREKFTSTFAELQSRDEPLTRFGAARRWAMIAEVHDSLDASLERLTLVYDDWWRRWRIQEYDPILDIPTQFSRTNPIRYAAVMYSMEDIEHLFDIRKELVVAVNGTAVSAGLCGYYRTFERFPRDNKLAYAQFMRKSSDVDPYDRSYEHLRYIMVDRRHAVDTPHGRLWIEPGQGIVYSRGQNLTDDRAAQHTYDGIEGDIVVWPPIRAIAREQGRLR